MFLIKKSVICFWLICALFLSGCTKKVDDYGQLLSMRRFTEDTMKEQGAVLRPIAKKFQEYHIDLSFLMSIFFPGNPIEIHLLTYRSDRLQVASFTQMEVPPNSSHFLDFAFELMPANDLNAPIFHGDVIKPMPGVDGMFGVDFYNTNSKDLNMDTFLGVELKEIQRALKLAAPYQKTKEEGRGDLTPHLDPFKSKYRIELKAPESSDVEKHKAYFKTVRETFQITLTAYLNALGRLNRETDQAVIKRNQEGHDLLINTLDKEDIAARLSKWMFEDDYEDFFLKGFWGKGD